MGSFSHFNLAEHHLVFYWVSRLLHFLFVQSLQRHIAVVFFYFQHLPLYRTKDNPRNFRNRTFCKYLSRTGNLFYPISFTNDPDTSMGGNGSQIPRILSVWGHRRDKTLGSTRHRDCTYLMLLRHANPSEFHRVRVRKLRIDEVQITSLLTISLGLVFMLTVSLCTF